METAIRVEAAVAVAPTQLSVHCYHQATANCWMLRKLFTRLFIVCYTTFSLRLDFVCSTCTYMLNTPFTWCISEQKIFTKKGSEFQKGFESRFFSCSFSVSYFIKAFLLVV